MNGWTDTSIGELGNVVTGTTPPSKGNHFRDEGVPFVTPSDMAAGVRRPSCERYIDPAWVEANKRRMLPPETTCVTCIGATIGKTCLTHEFSFANQQVNAVIPYGDRFDPHFVFYKLLSMADRYKAAASGAATPILNKTAFSAIELSVPPLPIQKRIAAILSAYDDLIEVNTRRIAILEEMARRIYEEWFVRYRFPGGDGTLPSDWITSPIGGRFKVVLGGTPSRSRADYWENGTQPWINSGKVNELRILEPTSLITDEALARSAAKMMPIGTTVLAITGATLGQVSRLGQPMSANQSVVGIYDESDLAGGFLHRWVESNIGSLIAKASGGAQQHINKGVVEEAEIVLPESGVLRQFEAQLKPLEDLILTLLRQEANLRAQRDLLLPRLVSGKLDVSRIETLKEELEDA